MVFWIRNTDYMNKQEITNRKKLDKNETFIQFLKEFESNVKEFKFRNSDYFKKSYNLNFVINGKVHEDYPISAKLFFGNRPFAVYKDGDSTHMLSESGAFIHFDQQPNSMVSILLHHPYINSNAPFSGLNIGLIEPQRLLRKSYQKRLFGILVTSMENYSFTGGGSFIDSLLMRWYNTRYRQIKEGREFESKLSNNIWAIIKWTICAIVGGFIAGYTASTFPTTIDESQFERCDSILIQNQEEISFIKQELSNNTKDVISQLDSVNQSSKELKSSIVLIKQELSSSTNNLNRQLELLKQAIK